MPGGAARRHRGRIEVQHHALALRQQPRQRDGGFTAVRVDRRQDEIGSGLAGVSRVGRAGWLDWPGCGDWSLA